MGWAVLHLFATVGPQTDAEAVVRPSRTPEAGGDQVVTAAILGHKADLALMALSADLHRLRAFQTAVRLAGLEVVSSYVSLTEVSEYAAGVPEEMKQARLYPQLPPEGKPAFCFYPMSKRRTAEDNWYALDFEARKALMMGHGAVGRTFHGRILQLITGSTGLDDWEWGVTLFGVHPDDLKACVYEMRFDEASARYAEFGPFFYGMVGDIDVCPRRRLGPVATVEIVDGQLATLSNVLTKLGHVVVAFSGGADSAFLAKVATDTLGASRAFVVTAVSPSLAPEELADCRALAREWDLRWRPVATDRIRQPRLRGQRRDSLLPLQDQPARRPGARCAATRCHHRAWASTSTTW